MDDGVKMRLTTVLCGLLLLLGGCMGVEYVPPLRLEGAGVEKLRLALDYYPAEFRASQRVIVRVGGREYDFVGYLVMDGNKDLRALAFGEMGGTLFDLAERKGRREVLASPEGVPMDPLLEGVMGDISHLFNARLDASAYAADRGNGAVAIVEARGNGVYIEHIFARGGLCTDSTEAINGRIVRRASYMDYRLFPGWARPMPARITISNLRWHYDLTIELLKMDAGPAGRFKHYGNQER